MAEIELTFELDDDKSLDDEVRAFKNETINQIMKVLYQVQGTMADSLKNRIIQDVYKAYTPKVYPRRFDNPQFGDPLTSIFYMDALGPVGGATATGDISIRGGLDYNPRGETSATTADINPDSPYYDAEHPEPIKPNPVHENELIKRIETGKGYDWDVPPKVYNGRPFWTNFVNEMIENGQLGAAIISEMQKLGVQDFEMTYDEIEREPQDGDY